MSESHPSIRERILEAAFSAFMRLGYGGTSTAEIARLARVSKRDLYANFSSKQAKLAACVTERAERMRRLRSHGMVRNPDRFENRAQAFDGADANPWYY